MSGGETRPTGLKRLRECVALFWIFARIGCYMVGGGYVMLPLLLEEVVKRRHWIAERDLLDIFAISQSTPGVIAVNTATFLGYRRARVAGAAAATAGVVTPALLIITLIAAAFPYLRASPGVGTALGGMRVAVAVLLVFAVGLLARRNIKSAGAIVLALAAFLALTVWNVSPVVVVLVAVALGLLRALLERRGRS